MVPFESSCAVSYSPSIVCEILVENREMFINPPVFSVPYRRSLRRMFDADKTKVLGLPYGKETMTIF